MKIKKTMEKKKFNILLHDFNTNRPEVYDIMPVIREKWEECISSKNYRGAWWPSGKPSDFEGFRQFVADVCKYRFWSKCEYEWLMLPWPPGNPEKAVSKAVKVDGWQQIEMNLDIITELFMKEVTGC